MIVEAAKVVAQRTAIGRAAHQLLDDPRVFEDPLALAVVGEDAARSLEFAPEMGASRTSRAFAAVRCRLAEDELTRAIARGATQYVVIGAGLDTYAYRNPYPYLRVFEVDHPATQAWKRGRLDTAGLAAPSWLTFVPTDFEERTLGTVLRNSGFQVDEITFFSWLGAPYLNAEAVIATFASIGSLPRGSGVVFDYAAERSFAAGAEPLALDALASRVARDGEAVRLVINPDALQAMLRAAGFRVVEDLGPAAIDEMYFNGRVDGLQISANPFHLVKALV